MTQEYMIEILAPALAEVTIRTFVIFPFAIIVVRMWVALGMAEWAGFPRPSMRQTIVIAFAAAFLP